MGWHEHISWDPEVCHGRASIAFAKSERADLANELEEHYEARRVETAYNPHVQELRLRSLKRLINPLKEEIAVFETHRLARR